MPVHDWSRIDAGTFHAFHTAWITHLSETLNGGLLPAGFYALPEQHSGRLIADVLTLQVPSTTIPASEVSEAGVAVADRPPQVRRKLSPTVTVLGSRRTLAIRHVSGHRVVALIEIVSPANKDRASHVGDFASKVEQVLRGGIHVLMVDVLAPGKHDPQGMHGVIWERLDEAEPYTLPAGEPFTAASYVAFPEVEAYVEHFAVGRVLTDMPLFLSIGRYIDVPLERTYTAAFQGLPVFWREMLEDHHSPG